MRSSNELDLDQMPARTASINAGASIMLEHVESASAISVGSRISSVERRTMTVPLTLATSEDVVYRNRFRQKRLKRFLSMVDEIVAASGTCNILDVGGNVAYWLGLEPLWRDRPCHITLVNIGGELVPDRRFTSIAGDARDLSRFRDLSFDLVHSNSVIEHVGLWRDQLRMAQEVRRLAPRYFVQTPNFWFPIEPHAGTLAGRDRHASRLRLLSAGAILRPGAPHSRRRTAARRARHGRTVSGWRH
jgi:hypothetical protein